MIISAGNNETFSFAHPIGVGLIESAINLTRLCLFDKPEFLLFVGSAGSYADYDIFDIVESTTASNIELSFFNNSSYTPIDNVIEAGGSVSKNQTIVNSSNYISTNFELCQNFKQYNIGIENMEYYSLLKVAKEFDVQIGGIFVVTNYCNNNAHQDFLNNHKKAINKLIDYLYQKNLIK